MPIRTVLYSLSLSFMMTACTTQGTGTGDLESSNPDDKKTARKIVGEVQFSWISSGDSDVQGKMVAEIPQQGSYSGEYMQITSNTSGSINGFSNNWYPGWGPWPGDGWYTWGPGWSNTDQSVFVTHYSGKVIALLRNTGDGRMRCRFNLASPQDGLAGGGMGECQLSNGDVVANAVLRQSQQN